MHVEDKRIVMSYLSNTRLIFTGRFQADVSTVNNDVRHFDDASFDKVFQEFQTIKVGMGGGILLDRALFA
jgi:hypothetical protein